jgi:hypothetical protein
LGTINMGDWDSPISTQIKAITKCTFSSDI